VLQLWLQLCNISPRFPATQRRALAFLPRAGNWKQCRKLPGLAPQKPKHTRYASQSRTFSNSCAMLVGRAQHVRCERNVKKAVTSPWNIRDFFVCRTDPNNEPSVLLVCLFVIFCKLFKLL